MFFFSITLQHMKVFIILKELMARFILHASSGYLRF